MDILISGASVAGPALAYWLRRYGFNATIVERAPQLRDGGHAVDFRGDVHLSVLRKMDGVLPAMERAQTGMGATWTVNAAGKKIARMPADLFAGDIEIQRGDLSRILVDASDTEYIFGDSITSMTEDADGVTVTFERTPPRRFDLVIGADGLHSTVRALTFGPEARFAKHLGLYVAIFTMENYLGLDHLGLSHTSPGRLAAYYSARNNTEARAMFFFGSEPLTYDRRDVEHQKRLLREAMSGVGWEVPRMLREMERAPEFYFDSVSQVHVDRWSHGRVTLLGDAAWCASPLSGVGSGLALVGAYVLAGELAAARGDHRVAFPRYEQLMRPYATRAQKSGEGIAGMMVPQGRFMTWMMRQSQRLMPYTPGMSLIAKSARKMAEAITLPEYPVGTAPRPRPSGRAS
ncbi:FAD-dependent monooxygenase [Nonomuraea sp. NPDC050536]|uniref:FAD-dependent monooxygenase n=1 Tax=Nonomuraea sp. NPDC050536 TaxID=3364366 RepID=UPI0037CB6CAF